MFSPGLYCSLSAAFSESLRSLPGSSFNNISSSVVTVAFGLVSRTHARHDGQVYGLDFGCEEERAAFACKPNHSFKQEPQKVWRQSRRVSGWYSISVHI